MNESILWVYFIFVPMYEVVWPSLHMKFIQFHAKFNNHIVISFLISIISLLASSRFYLVYTLL